MIGVSLIEIFGKFGELLAYFASDLAADAGGSMESGSASGGRRSFFVEIDAAETGGAVAVVEVDSAFEYVVIPGVIRDGVPTADKGEREVGVGGVGQTAVYR